MPSQLEKNRNIARQRNAARIVPQKRYLATAFLERPTSRAAADEASRRLARVPSDDQR
jgi:hypothetical protein